MYTSASTSGKSWKWQKNPPCVLDVHLHQGASEHRSDRTGLAALDMTPEHKIGASDTALVHMVKRGYQPVTIRRELDLRSGHAASDKARCFEGWV